MVTEGVSVAGVAGWPVIPTGWPVPILVGLSASREQMLSGTGARVYTAHRGWLGVVTGISADSTGSILMFPEKHWLHVRDT